jgi:serine protease inhibitor
VVTASASAAFVNDKLQVLPEFRTAIETELRAQVKTLDFAVPGAERTINEWSNQATRGLIKSSLPRELVDRDTALSALNALCFRGYWAERFQEAQTKLQPFTLQSGERVQAKLMHRELDAAYAELPAQGAIPAVRALELDYRGREFSLVVLVPTPNAPLSPLEQQLDEPRLVALLSALREHRVNVTLPRFRFVSTAPVSLKSGLSALGMRSAFQPERADFSGMASPSSSVPRRFLSDVYQSVYLQVDESGTTAAAATVGRMQAVSGKFPLTRVDFRADQPFLFMLRHKASSSVVMMGRIDDPRWRSRAS